MTGHLQRSRTRLASLFSSVTLDTRKKTLEQTFKDLKERERERKGGKEGGRKETKANVINEGC